MTIINKTVFDINQTFTFVQHSVLQYSHMTPHDDKLNLSTFKKGWWLTFQIKNGKQTYIQYLFDILYWLSIHDIQDYRLHQEFCVDFPVSTGIRFLDPIRAVFPNITQFHLHWILGNWKQRKHHGFSNTSKHMNTIAKIHFEQSCDFCCDFFFLSIYQL